jgi:hypothetical protein
LLDEGQYHCSIRFVKRPHTVQRMARVTSTS